MTDQAQDLQAQLATLLATVQQQPQQTGWNTAKPQAMTINGVAVPISVETPRGKIRCYLSLPAECTASPDALLNALAALDAQNYPLDIWEGRQQGSGWNNNSGSGQRGNWYGARGGWRR